MGSCASLSLHLSANPSVRRACYAGDTRLRDPKQIRDALVRQLYSPVRWVETVEFMINNGIKSILECGPGKVLTGLNKRINSEINTDIICKA